MPLNRRDDSIGGTPQQILRDGLDTESGFVEVVTGERARGSAVSNRFDQRVVPQIIDMGTAAAPSLEVDKDSAAAVAARAAEAEIHLAR